MDKREHRRVEMQGLSGDISDGIGFFPGIISDISRYGMRITDLPKRVNSNARRMTVVVSGHGRNFKMLVHPKWTEETGLRKMVGFEIVNTPWEWTDFVMKNEPKPADENVWDVINI